VEGLGVEGNIKVDPVKVERDDLAIKGQLSLTQHIKRD
jgi:hypothetical protein